MLKPILAALVITGVAATAACADAVEDFYKGKTITVVTSTGVGGPFDLTARALARHMPRYIPARPAMIVRNMPGGGHVLATNFMYTQADKDGTFIATVNNIDPAAPGARRPRRALRRPQVQLARFHRHQQSADRRLAHVRLQDHGRRDGARACDRRDRRRLRHLHLSERHERGAGHQVQDRDGLQEHRRARPRDGARRGAGPATQCWASRARCWRSPSGWSSGSSSWRPPESTSARRCSRSGRAHSAARTRPPRRSRAPCRSWAWRLRGWSRPAAGCSTWALTVRS